MKFILASIVTWIAFVGCDPVYAASNILFQSYATTNVTTSAYVTLGTAPITTNHIEICDSSGHFLKLATGSAGNEVDIVNVPVSNCGAYILFPQITVGTRLSLKALDASATTGGISIGFIP